MLESLKAVETISCFYLCYSVAQLTSFLLRNVCQLSEQLFSEIITKPAKLFHCMFLKGYVIFHVMSFYYTHCYFLRQRKTVIFFKFTDKHTYSILTFNTNIFDNNTALVCSFILKKHLNSFLNLILFFRNCVIVLIFISVLKSIFLAI